MGIELVDLGLSRQLEFFYNTINLLVLIFFWKKFPKFCNIFKGVPHLIDRTFLMSSLSFSIYFRHLGKIGSICEKILDF